MAYRTLTGKALKLSAGSHVRVEIRPDAIVVTRGNGGHANELLSAAVKASLRYTAGGRLQLDSDALKQTGATFIIKQ